MGQEPAWSDANTIGTSPRWIPIWCFFLRSLLDSEQIRLSQFLSIHDCQTKVCSLGQDPLFSCVASSCSVLHTLIRNCHIQWSQEAHRWLTCREVLLAQIFPTTNATLLACQPGSTLATIQPICSMNVPRVEHGYAPRRRNEVAHQGGNSMTVSTVGSILQFMFFLNALKLPVFVILRCPHWTSGDTLGV